MTPTQIAELEAKCEKATPGPWDIGNEDEVTEGIPHIEIDAGPCPSPAYKCIAHVQSTMDESDDFELTDEDRANAAFIAAARTAIPELLAERKVLVERQRTPGTIELCALCHIENPHPNMPTCPDMDSGNCPVRKALKPHTRSAGT